jgi:hypothetical protein
MRPVVYKLLHVLKKKVFWLNDKQCMSLVFHFSVIGETLFSQSVSESKKQRISDIV